MSLEEGVFSKGHRLLQECLGLNYQKYATNTLWLVSERVLRLGINLFVSVWVARYLGPEHFGSLSFSLSFVLLFSAIAWMGLNQIVVRDLVVSPEDTEEILASAFWLKVVGTLLMWLGLAAVWPWLDTTEAEMLMVFWVAGSTFFQVFDVLDFHFQALVQSRYVVWAQTAHMLISSATKLWLIWLQADLHWFAMAYALEHLVQALGLWILHHVTQGGMSFLSAKLARMKSLMQESWPLLLSGVTVLICARMDQVMLKQMIGPEATGQYAAAVRISEAWYFVPMAICNSVFPSIVRSKAESLELYERRLRQLFGLMIWMGVAVALITTWLAPWGMPFLYGQNYSESGAILQIHIWAGVFVGLGFAVGKWDVNENLMRYGLGKALLGVLINLILNYLTIPVFGGLGAAVSTLVSQMVSSYFSMALWKPTRVSFFLVNRSLFSGFGKT